MLMEKDLPLDLGALVSESLGLFPQAKPDTAAALIEFIYDRLAGMLREQGYSAQEVDAVLALRPQRLGDVAKRLAAVRAFASLPEAPSLAAANKRIGNILKKAEGEVSAQVNEPLLRESAEQALFGSMKDITPRADAQFKAGDYTASLQTLAGLRTTVDKFFDAVMVNAEDAQLRANRLGLLATLHAAMNRVADLSKLAA
jgi:glycyl-tRNA synthetase beta chain